MESPSLDRYRPMFPNMEVSLAYLTLRLEKDAEHAQRKPRPEWRPEDQAKVMGGLKLGGQTVAEITQTTESDTVTLAQLRSALFLAKSRLLESGYTADACNGALTSVIYTTATRLAHSFINNRPRHERRMLTQELLPEGGKLIDIIRKEFMQLLNVRQ